jgi:CRISPR-associated endonuclease/helicase Cas3
MNVLLVSQCDKRALTQTRRILDQFAERRGDRTWQTPITQDGLDALRSLLRHTARKNTAVACHWIRGADRSELVWVVGDRRRFNAQGAVPTNTTQRDVLRQQDENDWHTGEDIRLLAMLASLLHDIGKATNQFQDRLKDHAAVGRNQIRHEWVSLRLFEAFVGDDGDDRAWLRRMASAPSPASWLRALQRDGIEAANETPLARLPPLAKAVGWLVLTHHRLPVLPNGTGARLGKPVASFCLGDLADPLSHISANWNETRDAADASALEPYWAFRNGLPMAHADWQQQARKVCEKLLALVERRGASGWTDNPYVMHLSRLALMLADHHYSSLRPDSALRLTVSDAQTLKLHANTDSEGRLKQTLVEHLLGVARDCAELCHALPRLEQHLPRLVRHKALLKRNAEPRFRWQDKASELAASHRGAAAEGGAFVVNLASTGCGKTLANVRVMNALADPALGLRCSIALGLRTLTLQTGRALQGAARLHNDDVAVCVGGAASRELAEQRWHAAEATGSASRAALLEAEGDDGIGEVRYEGPSEHHPLLAKALADERVKKLLLAPVLVCTIDHLTPATESLRGGHQIAPMLRLMSSDLVIDELDDFDVQDLPAVARLVHWAGLLGARVLISSATLPPALVLGLFEAYRTGRKQHANNRGLRPGHLAPVVCAWIDEFDQTAAPCSDNASFDAAHGAFAGKRAQRLAHEPPRRRAELWPLALKSPDEAERHRLFAAEVTKAATALHARHHQIDPVTGRRVSLGLVRMANIGPLVEVALALYSAGAPSGHRIHLCVYHSQYPLLLRSAIEAQLDTVLARQRPDAVFLHPSVRGALDASTEADQLFIVLGSPVTEVGRDHDYDWAVVEPSSMRSVIQLAGRVWRHRPGKVCDEPNVVLFESNLRCWPPDLKRVAYHRPGFETRRYDDRFLLNSKSVRRLLDPGEWQQLDSRPRILARPAPLERARLSLVDLEHARLQWLMNGPPERLGAYSWWRQPPQDALLTGMLPQHQPFRAEAGDDIELCLQPDDAAALGMRLTERREHPRRGRPALWVEIDRSRHQPIEDSRVQGRGIQPWGPSNYLQALHELAEARGLSAEACARRYGLMTLRRQDPASSWQLRFHAALGFTVV